MLRVYLLVTVFFSTLALFGQTSKKDSVMTVPMFVGSYGLSTPGGDMAKRFGNNAEAGIGFFVKTRSNWIWGIESSYFFGKTIRESGIFTGIVNSSGKIIGQDGLEADVRVFERGTKLPVIKFGRLFPVKIGRAGKNSGIVFMAGWGILQHKIKIEDVTNTAPQVTGNYVKGYDRLTNGGMLVENIGYLYLDKKRYVNMFILAELAQGFTQNRRTINFSTGSRDTQKRLDLLYTIKIGICVPIYKKIPDEYYYY